MAFRAFGGQAPVAALPPAVQREVDYAKDIQPLLAERCYGCHGPDRQESDLRWDLKASALRGGRSGLALVAGKSAESRVIRLVAGLEKDLVMPKKGARLTPEQIGLLRAWIDQGAPWPAELAEAKVADRRDWWAFKRPARPAIPEVRVSGFALRNPVDNFIVAKLQQLGLAPAPEADRRTLVRRLSFDLTGLPPTPEAVDQFAADPAPDAYERLVERLLDSPRYGERWARHWLDLVHFGETHGYDKDKLRPNAWPYRDYVIRAFNQDRPYSRFVQEQLAGDVLFPDESDGIVALGFIAAGPWDFVGHVELPISKTDGLIARYNDRDDMVMTTLSTFQSLTVHCARCHDHKFDPISQKEYYRLQSVFAGVDRADRPYDPDPSVHGQRRILLAQGKSLEARRTELEERKAKVSSPGLARLDQQLTQARAELAAATATGGRTNSPSNGYHSQIESKPEAAKWVEVDLGRVLPIESLRLVPARPTDFPDTPGFGFPIRFKVEVSTDGSFTQAELVTDQTASDFPNPDDTPVDFKVNAPRARFIRVTATRLWERTRDFVFALAELQVFLTGTNAAHGASVTALDSIESGRWAKAYLVDGFSSVGELRETAPTVEELAWRRQRQTELDQFSREREATLDELLGPVFQAEWASVQEGLARTEEALRQLPKPQLVYAAAHDFTPESNFIPAQGVREVYWLTRGDVKRPRELMTPAGLACVPGPEPEFELPDVNDEGARRAELAKWITDPRNLLTRRSIVNRVWQYHFGHGLVDTPNDFGHMGSQPTHPELLDWLAYWFQENGESFKKLDRLLVTSATYRQSSRYQPEFARVDGDDRYLWRREPRRLDAESIRDEMLLISGQLDLRMGGPSDRQFFFKDDHSPVYDYTRFDVENAAARRRSIYRFIVRSVPDPFMDCLDAADPSQLVARRYTTSTALQALAILNDPFVLSQCEHFARRLGQMSGELNVQIELACRWALGRKPTSDEAEEFARYAGRHGLASLCRIIFNSTEFEFVD